MKFTAKDFTISAATIIVIAGIIFGAGTYKNKVDKLDTTAVSKEVFSSFVEKNEDNHKKNAKEHEKIVTDLDKIDGKIDTLILYQLNKENNTAKKVADKD